jgi:DNA-directed RNA polymerase subunit E'
MYYRVKLKDHVRVPPEHMDKPMKEAILVMLKDRFDGFISKEFGVVVNVVSVGNIGDGVLVPGDGAPYYDTEFELIAFRPEMQEVILGRVRDMADFGAFLNMGPIDGMVHVSQTMDDFVSFSKDKVLTGRDSARSLKIGDDCRARVTAVSFKDPSNPKIGCTMRQSGLGKLEWIYEPAAVEPKKKTGKADKKEESK